MPGNTESIKIALESEEVETGELEEGMEGEMPTPEGEEGGAGGGGGGTVGDMMGGLMSSISGMSAMMGAVLGGVMAIVGILLSMEPIQKLMKAFMKVVQAFFAPLAMMLIKLLSPVLKSMIKLLPLWYDFIRDPWSTIEKVLGYLRKAAWNIITRLPKVLAQAIISIFPSNDPPKNWWDALKQSLINSIPPLKIGKWISDKINWGDISAWDIATSVFPPLKVLDVIKAIDWPDIKVIDILRAIDLPVIGVWDIITAIDWPTISAESILNAIFPDWVMRRIYPDKEYQLGGVVQETGMARVHSGEAVINRQDFQRLLNELRNNRNGDTNIELSGGIGDFIEVKQKNRNIR